jgi:hypothetical protein
VFLGCSLWKRLRHGQQPLAFRCVVLPRSFLYPVPRGIRLIGQECGAEVGPDRLTWDEPGDPHLVKILIWKAEKPHPTEQEFVARGLFVVAQDSALSKYTVPHAGARDATETGLTRHRG